MHDIEKKIFELISEKANTDPNSLSFDTKLSDLSISSLAVLDIILTLEEQFHIQIPLAPEILEDFRTIGQIIKKIHILIHEQKKQAT